MPRSFFVILAVQFFSTVADNAFLIVAIARVLELGHAVWLIPILKISAILAYVLLAPWVGPVADAFRKGRVMLASNLLKTVSVVLLLTGVEPVWCIGIAGLAAALYAPAKYGLVTECVEPASLVKANGYFEGVTICSVLLGTALGGFLVSPWLVQTFNGPVDAAWVQSSLSVGMGGVLVITLVATVLSAAVADSGKRYATQPVRPLGMFMRFGRENRTLWKDPLGGLSMGVTTLLWGVAATLQLLVLRWAEERLSLTLDKAAYLQGFTALGILVGALLASRWVPLKDARAVLPLGLGLGLLLPVMLVVDSVAAAACLMVLIGTLAGLFVVPMNALLQHRGVQLLTAGRSVAVQGFNENAGILVVLGVYSLATAAGVPLAFLIVGLATGVTVGMAIFLKLSKNHHHSVMLAG